MSTKQYHPNSELKGAFKNLRVNEPLRLSKDSLAFKPPSNEAERKEVPLVEAPQFDYPLPRAIQNEEPQKRDSQSGLARDELLRDRDLSVSSEKNIAFGNPVDQSEKPQSKRTKSEAPPNEQAGPELPQNESAEFGVHENQVPHSGQTQIASGAERRQRPQFKSSRIDERRALNSDDGPGTTPSSGFFKLSHGCFSEPLLQNLSGDCFRLFLWLSSRAWRYPTSDGIVRASVRYIGDQTRMSHASISRSLKTLKDAGLIDIYETDFKKGNLWYVSSLVCGGRTPDDEPPRKDRPQNKAPQKSHEGISKGDASSLNLRAEVPQNEGNIRSIKKGLKKSSEEGSALAPCRSETPFRDTSEKSVPVDLVLARFESELGEEERQRMMAEAVETHSTKSFQVWESLAKKLAAQTWFHSRQLGECDGLTAAR